MRNPLVWFVRVRKRCGYGVHSPFAFALITQVLYTPGRYYAYEWLDLQFTCWQRHFFTRRLKVCQLLFRLANYFQPADIVVCAATIKEQSYLHQGCRKAKLHVYDKGLPEDFDMLYTRVPVSDVCARVKDGGVVVVDCLQRNKRFWHELCKHDRVRVTFNLYDVGVAVCLPELNKQDYIINW